MEMSGSLPTLSFSKKSDANSLTGVWKNPLDPPSSRESSTDTASTSGVTTPGGGWADMVKFGRAQSGRSYSSIKKDTGTFESSPHTFYFFRHERNSPQPP
jgi:hypothetical protein